MERIHRALVTGLLSIGVCLAPAAATAQSSAQTLPATPEEALLGLADSAAIIFAGTVRGVRRTVTQEGLPTGVVEIDFAVSDAIRGVSGPSYTLREWAGLWPAGDEPFRVGQQFLLLLHAPNAGGLSSPVGGSDGAIPIRGAVSPAAVQVSSDSARSRRAAPLAELSSRVIDLSWIATRVPVAVAYREPRPISRPGAHAAAVSATSVDSSAASARVPVTASYSAIVQTLRTRQESHAAFR